MIRVFLHLTLLLAATLGAVGGTLATESDLSGANQMLLDPVDDDLGLAYDDQGEAIVGSYSNQLIKPVCHFFSLAALSLPAKSSYFQFIRAPPVLRIHA